MLQQDNQFQFSRNQHLEQIVSLQASMNDFSYSKHAHEEYSFGVTLSGRQDFFSNGIFYRSHPGNVIIFNPGEIHDGHSGVSDTLRYRMLYIHPDQLWPMIESAGVKFSRDYQIKDTLLDDPVLRQSILNLILLIENKASGKLQLECELYQLASRIARYYAHSLADRRIRRIDTVLSCAKEYIRGHLLEEMSLDQISQQVGLSKYHFLRLFRQQIGITPYQYILNCRINRAREALDAGATLNDAVFDYGFSDLSHFNRRFKPIYGMTPNQYRNHICHRQ